MAKPGGGGGPAILPTTRGALPGVNTFHRHMILQTQAIRYGHPIISDLRWHNGLDRVYFQMLGLNLTAGMISIDWDVFLRFDNVEDDLPYNSGTQNFPITVNGGPPVFNYDVQSFPLGGLAFPSSCEYYVRLTLNPDPGAGAVMVSLWATPELWYDFRTIPQVKFNPNPS